MDKPCFELKGSLFTLTVLQLFDNDLKRLETQLTERVKMAPGFFNQTPVVIDLHALDEQQQNLDFFDLREILLSLSIIPVGVKGALPAVKTLLEAAGLAILAEARHSAEKTTATATSEPEIPVLENEVTEKQKPEEPAPEIQEAETGQQEYSREPETNPQEAAEPSVPSGTVPAKVVKQTIRSGRQIYARGGDLIIIGSVSAGAEVLADGNIHVYGTLRGRAMAGVQGDQSAAIFCHSLQSELVSIAGIYLLSEDIPEDKIGTPVQVYMHNERLEMDHLLA